MWIKVNFECCGRLVVFHFTDEILLKANLSIFYQFILRAICARGIVGYQYHQWKQSAKGGHSFPGVMTQECERCPFPRLCGRGHTSRFEQWDVIGNVWRYDRIEIWTPYLPHQKQTSYYLCYRSSKTIKIQNALSYMHACSNMTL